MATAELAVAMPSVLVVLGLGLAALSAGVDQVRCVDAARAVARLAARGEPPQRAVDAGRHLAPRGAGIRVTTRGGEVSVVVVAPPVAGLRLLGLEVRPSADAVAVREDALADAGPWPGETP
ncbi:TadE family type IV pilus minor pilin [Knoellia sp. p5-6-4]|uniref:TadE family type IV pilus minor pilin n=1 Tax=unclassified Knoellia TaxID=2618719 RepID=UPI0023DB9693|nr:TadE family type IV pilus minor pilin [Knoellia sp. p5-6-4]MDF2144704.1 TadE family type IV pilus minor pilin [Knoellia sp. p5-6-4]